MSDPLAPPVLADAAARALRIEEASLRAWPALTDSDFDGWRLRFADGYTRRANSITPLRPSRLAVDDKIATCERLYADRGLPTIFRLTPFAAGDLDELLASRGYRLGAAVEVRARALAAPDATSTGTGVRPRGRAASPGIHVRAHPIDAWLDIFEELSQTPKGNRAAHRAVLNTVPGLRRLMVLWTGDRPAACGMAVLVDGLLGLFDLVTAPAQRNLGHGSLLLLKALRWGQAAGGTEAYLQVLETNEVAKRIYDRAGFEVVYRYHYRERAR